MAESNDFTGFLNEAKAMTKCFLIHFGSNEESDSRLHHIQRESCCVYLSSCDSKYTRLAGHNVLFLHNTERTIKSSTHSSVPTVDVDLM